MSAHPQAPSHPPAAAPGAPTALDDLRAAVSGLFAAERRLRSRDSAPGELSHAHIRSLHALSEGEMTAGQLARSTELNPASVTAMLDHLEQSGIVTRRRSTTDRRVLLVGLTASGRELVEAKTARWKARWAERLGGYSEAELAVGERIVAEVADLLDSIVSERAGD